MAKTDNEISFFQNLLRAKLYKRNQGRLTRQLTFVGIMATTVYGLWSLSQGPLGEYEPLIQIGVPFLVGLVAAWVTFRTVHWPKFADFLVAVEAEMDKVMWPSKTELHRSTIVVLFTMFFLGFTLFMYDLMWVKIFQSVGILKVGSGGA